MIQDVCPYEKRHAGRDASTAPELCSQWSDGRPRPSVHKVRGLTGGDARRSIAFIVTSRHDSGPRLRLTPFQC